MADLSGFRGHGQGHSGSCPNSLDFFQCSDGPCLPNDLVCDGRRHCADGGDEVSCDPEVKGHGDKVRMQTKALRTQAALDIEGEG